MQLVVFFTDKDFRQTSNMPFTTESIKKLKEMDNERAKSFWMTYANKLSDLILIKFPKNYKSWEAFVKDMEKYFKKVEKEAKKNPKYDMEKAMKKAPVFKSELDVKDIRVIFVRKDFVVNVANSPEDALKKFMLIINEIKV